MNYRKFKKWLKKSDKSELAGIAFILPLCLTVFMLLYIFYIKNEDIESGTIILFLTSIINGCLILFSTLFIESNLLAIVTGLGFSYVFYTIFIISIMISRGIAETTLNKSEIRDHKLSKILGD